MRLLIQRVNHASVKVDGEVIGNIGKGFLVLVGIGQNDTREIADKYMKKMLGLRIFEDENAPAHRRQGLGVQLLGQAVSTYRPLGRDRLRLCCAPDNGIAQRFYQKYGFVKVGEEPGARGPLDVLEKYIGFEAKES